MRKSLAQTIEELHMPEPNSGCWIWTGALSFGYGVISRGGKHIRAHIISYQMAKGKTPDGLVLDHLCRNRACINPDHLEAVTSRTNVLRGVGASARNARKTHCLRGHAFDANNTRINPKTGFRQCKKCEKSSGQAKLRRMKAMRTRSIGWNGERKGGANPRAKLTEENVIFVRQNLSLGSGELAKMFGVSESTIRGAKTGRRWGHLPGASDAHVKSQVQA